MLLYRHWYNDKKNFYSAVKQYYRITTLMPGLVFAFCLSDIQIQVDGMMEEDAVIPVLCR